MYEYHSSIFSRTREAKFERYCKTCAIVIGLLKATYLLTYLLTYNFG